MSRIDELIAELCPNGVEYKRLGDIATYSDTRVAADALNPESFVGVDNLLSNKAGKGTAGYRPNTALLTEYRTGDVLIGNIRPYLKKIWLAASDGGCSGDVLAIRLRPERARAVDSRFLYQVLGSDKFFAYNTQHAKGAKMPRGDKAAILRFDVPVPPLEVQREVVRVLELFQSLEAELEAELEARRRQYAHYRDSLLDFEGAADVTWHPIGELGALFRGRRFVKSDYVEVGIPAIHYGQLYTFYGTTSATAVSQIRTELAPAMRYAESGDVVIAEVGETVADVGRAVAWLGATPVAIHDGCFGFRHSMNPTFVAYCFQTRRFQAQKDQYVSRAKMKRLSLDGLKRIEIPVPSLDEQRRVVEILNGFDALVNDLSFGLPAELAARRMQYEHYRDRLLTFQEAV